MLRTGVGVRNVEAVLERPDGSRVSVLVMDGNAMGVERARLRVLETGRPYRGELSYPTAEGSRLFEYVLAAIPGEAGGPEAVVGVARDVTEQREATPALRYIAANARCVLWHAEIEDHGERYCRWNTRVADEEAAQRFMPLDVPPDSTYLRTWYRSVLPEDRERRDEHSNRAVRAGESYRCTFRTRGADGVARWLQEDVVVQAVAPGRWRAAGICADTTDRRHIEQALRESEERLRFALIAGRVGCWDWEIGAGRVAWRRSMGSRRAVFPAPSRVSWRSFTPKTGIA